MQLQVIESTTASSDPQPLSSLSDSIMRRPCYLADLRNEIMAADDTFGVNFTVVFPPLIGLVNGEAWHDESTYVKEVPVGTVQQVGECVFSLPFRIEDILITDILTVHFD
jgi:hypothetical protein